MRETYPRLEGILILKVFDLFYLCDFLWVQVVCKAFGFIKKVKLEENKAK